MKFAIARQLSGKRVITTDGEEIGRIVDLTVDENTGKLENVLLEPNPDSGLAKSLERDKSGKLLSIPYGAVLDVKDVMVVDRREIGAAQ